MSVAFQYPLRARPKLFDQHILARKKKQQQQKKQVWLTYTSVFNVVFPKQLSAESEKVTFIPRIFSNRGETKLQAPIFLCSSWLHIYSEKYSKCLYRARGKCSTLILSLHHLIPVLSFSSTGKFWFIYDAICFAFLKSILPNPLSFLLPGVG